MSMNTTLDMNNMSMENQYPGVPQQFYQEKDPRPSTMRIVVKFPIAPHVSRKNNKKKKQKIVVLMVTIAIPAEGSFSKSDESIKNEPALSLPVQNTTSGLVTTDASPVSAETPETSTGRTNRRQPLNPAVFEWQCNPCNRMFRRKGGLRQHNAHHHSGDKPFVCKTCGKKYQGENKLQEHQRRHTAQAKLHKCQECPRQYYGKYDLKRHVDMHHGNSRFICKYCEKHFVRTDHLLDHERCHEKGTAYLNKSKIRV